MTRMTRMCISSCFEPVAFELRRMFHQVSPDPTASALSNQGATACYCELSGHFVSPSCFLSASSTSPQAPITPTRSPVHAPPVRRRCGRIPSRLGTTSLRSPVASDVWRRGVVRLATRVASSSDVSAASAFFWKAVPSDSKCSFQSNSTDIRRQIESSSTCFFSDQH